MRDIALNQTTYFTFCAYRFDTGAPAAVTSIAVQAYPNASATQVTGGITITQPDSITGYYNVQVDATVANGYAAGTCYSLVITTGTVNSVSVVGTVIGEFSIRVGTPGLITTGIAQTSASGTLVLAAATSYADDLINGATAVIVAGTGVGQSRQIYDFVGSTDTASVSPNWVTTPDTTSVYEIYATPPSGTVAGSLPAVDVTAVGGSATAGTNLKADYDGTGYAGGGINKQANAVQAGGQTLSASGTVTLPNGTLASTTNITAGTVAVASSVTALAGSAGIKKNTAKAAFMFLMTDAITHNPATGLTVTATRSLDGAAFAACANAVSEVSAGWYKIDLAAGDLNGDTVALKFTATGADATNVSIVTGA